MAKKDFDLDGDGITSKEEIEAAKLLKEAEAAEEKADTQKHMAWVAMISMLGFTLFLFLPFMSNERVSALGDLLGLFYIALACVVGAYMGLSAYMSRIYTKIMVDIFLLIGELGLPIAGCVFLGGFIYVILKYILSDVTEQVSTMHGIISMLDNRIKNMNNDMIKLDILISHSLDLKPDEERISRADGKEDARRD